MGIRVEHNAVVAISLSLGIDVESGYTKSLSTVQQFSLSPFVATGLHLLERRSATPSRKKKG